jgi:hypothetical protein
VAKRHQELLARLDPVGLNRYQITENDVQQIEKYLDILQKPLRDASTWQDILHLPEFYATAILIHEVVELRILEARRLNPLQQRRQRLQRLLAEHIDAHVYAIYEEGLYLQEVITRLFGQRFEVATIIKANRDDDRDLQLFLESEIGIFLLEEDRVREARQVLTQLKGELS